MLDTIWKEVAPIICSAAPAVATALGSPVAGAATSILCNSFNVSPNKPEELVNKILENIPAATDKLKEVEITHSEIFTKLMSIKMPTEIEAHLKVKWN